MENQDNTNDAFIQAYVSSALDTVTNASEPTFVGQTTMDNTFKKSEPLSTTLSKNVNNALITKAAKNVQRRSKHPNPTKGAFGNGRKDTRIQKHKTEFIKQFEAEVTKHYNENKAEYDKENMTYEQVYSIIAQQFIQGKLR